MCICERAIPWTSYEPYLSVGGRGHEGQAAQRQTLLMVRGATLLSVRGKSPHNKSVVVLRAKSGGLKTVYTYSLLRAFVRYWKKP